MFGTSQSMNQGTSNQGTSNQAIRNISVHVEANIHVQSGNAACAGISKDFSRSRLIQGLLSQRVLYEAEFDQSSMTGITTRGISQFGYNDMKLPTHKQIKHKVNKSEIAYMEVNIDEAHPTTKPAEIKLPKRTISENFDHLSNRFNPISNEEPAVIKPSHCNPQIVIEDHLICAVCLDYFYNPYQCPCSHIFCEPCLRQLYHNCTRNLKCPICRSQVKYIEPANRVREDIRKLKNPVIKQRELFEKSAKYKKWPLPPIGPLPFLKIRQKLVPKQDQTIIILASALLFIVCSAILYLS